MPISRHISRESSPADRGRGLGGAKRDEIGVTVAFYERMFALDMGMGREETRAAGRRVGEALARVRPQALEEICGIARGAGLPEELLLAINARTEILARGEVNGLPRLARGRAECSTAGVEADAAHGALLAQNWDFHPDIAPARLLWIAAPGDRPGWATFTEAGLLAKTGINADGLALTVNFLPDLRAGGLRGVPIHVLVRWLLEDCVSIDEVETIVDRTARSCSMCVTVAARVVGARGSLAAFELTPDGYGLVAPDADGHVAHTNHFVTSASPLASAAMADYLANSVGRVEQLERQLRSHAGAIGLGQLLELLSDESDPRNPLFVRAVHDVRWIERYRTLATVGFDVETAQMWLRTAPDEPFECIELARLPAAR